MGRMRHAFRPNAPYTAVMSDPLSWRVLYAGEGLARARAIATVIEAMEFEVRLCDVATDLPVEALEADLDKDGVYRIEARGEDWSDLAEVLEQIIAEQSDFDALLERRDRSVLSAQRVVLGVVVVAVIVLALMGIARL